MLGEAGDLGEADLTGRQGISDEISSPRVPFGACPLTYTHTHIYICRLAFLVRMWLAVSMKIQSMNPEKVRGKLSLQS